MRAERTGLKISQPSKTAIHILNVERTLVASGELRRGMAAAASPRSLNGPQSDSARHTAIFAHYERRYDSLL